MNRFQKTEIGRNFLKKTEAEQQNSGGNSVHISIGDYSIADTQTLRQAQEQIKKVGSKAKKVIDKVGEHLSRLLEYPED